MLPPRPSRKCTGPATGVARTSACAAPWRLVLQAPRPSAQHTAASATRTDRVLMGISASASAIGARARHSDQRAAAIPPRLGGRERQRYDRHSGRGREAILGQEFGARATAGRGPTRALDAGERARALVALGRADRAVPDGLDPVLAGDRVRLRRVRRRPQLLRAVQPLLPRWEPRARRADAGLDAL